MVVEIRAKRHYVYEEVNKCLLVSAAVKCTSARHYSTFLCAEKIKIKIDLLGFKISNYFL
jgi:hypothetical protein